MSLGRVSDTQILQDRVRTLKRDIVTVDRLVKNIDFTLSSRVGTWLGEELARLQDQLQALSNRALSIAQGQTAAVEIWTELHEVSLRSQYTLEDSLSLILGATYRKSNGLQGSDTLYYSIADGLVDELIARTNLGVWKSFTIPTLNENYSFSTSAIGLRFPGTFWDLPVIAHEVAHFLSRSITDYSQRTSRHPLEDLARGGSLTFWSEIQELFADLVAAYTLGPAYAWACVLRSFDPIEAAIMSDETHPPATQRVCAILAGLRLLDSPTIEDLCGQVWRTWLNCARAAGAKIGEQPPEPETIGPMAAMVAHLMPMSGYVAWAEADRLAWSLDEPRALPEISTNTSLAAVLNGAWRARVARPDQTDRVEDVAASWCQTIMNRRLPHAISYIQPD